MLPPFFICFYIIIFTKILQDFYNVKLYVSLDKNALKLYNQIKRLSHKKKGEIKMKKVLALFISVLLILGIFTMPTFAASKALTAKDYGNMKKTTEFVCEMYKNDYYFNSNGPKGAYTNEIFDKCVEMFPKKYTPSESDQNGMYWGTLKVTEKNILSAAKAIWPYIEESTLKTLLVSKVLKENSENKKDGVYTLQNPGGWSGTYIKNADVGEYLGYKKNSNGTYSLYYSVKPVIDEYDAVPEKERASFDALAEKNDWGDFEYKGKMYYNGVDGYYTFGKAEYRVFNYSIVKSKIKYNSDKWGAKLPKAYAGIPYDITYKLNGGKNNGKNPKSSTSDTALTLKDPTRKGYTFKGWYSDAKFKNKVTKIKKGRTKNITLYAKWSKNTYTITYKLNKGKNNAKNPKKYTVTTSTIKFKNPTRKGYTFKGWYKGSKKITQIKKGSAGNITLTAKWAKK